MNTKQAKKIRQTVKRSMTDVVRTVYDHMIKRKPRMIPGFLWRRFLHYILFG